ncbi:MAG: hypothetical protein AAGA72_17515 [Pseudomonadota bacterium]
MKRAQRLSLKLTAILVICLSLPIAHAEIKKGDAVPVLDDAEIVLHDPTDSVTVEPILDEETPCSFILFEDENMLPEAPGMHPEEEILLCKAALKTLKAQPPVPLERVHDPEPPVALSGGGGECSVVGEVGVSCAP